MPTQGASITVQGGLDLVSSSHALFRTPGAATKLQNFESASVHHALQNGWYYSPIEAYRSGKVVEKVEEVKELKEEKKRSPGRPKNNGD